ncbi:SprT-like domain-containing protein [Roseivirga sp. BDSF3-8]|uniref:SprT-like domain-containing protein n=1 Tax=Roseivirga sp. BDSF3-8 TaxID=3241598 RepID=UPI0035318120
MKNHVPQNAVHYCVDLWQKYPFRFRLAGNRRTKFGDYRFERATGIHIITVNSSLNPYAFLITFVHEVAHLVAFDTHGHHIKPHGKEWKITFRRLFQPLLSDLIFPGDVLVALKHYFINPKASSYSDPKLALALQAHDRMPEGKDSLAGLPRGTRFKLNGRVFEKGLKRRTRVMCIEVKTGRNYLVSLSALVERCA